jgi:1-acyl-sn-glycerol-3-phosphate acyltransferase
VGTIVLGTLSLASSLFDRRGYFGHGCARAWARLILGTTGVSVAVEGLDRLRPEGSYVFVSNHQSHYDTAVLFATLPHQLRIIAKASLGRFPFLGWHLQRTGHILVDRRRPDRAAIFGWADRLLAQKLSLIVYPEGTRSDDGLVDRFKPGIFQIALHSGLPVVPLSLVGTRHVMRKGALTVRPGAVRLVLHDPIDTQGLSEADPREFAERIRRVIAPVAESDVDARPRSAPPPSPPRPAGAAAPDPGPRAIAGAADDDLHRE